MLFSRNFGGNIISRPMRAKQEIIFASALFLLSLGVRTGSAQQLDYVLGELIVLFKADVDAEDWALQHDIFEAKSTGLHLEKCLSDRMNIWHIRFDDNAIDRFAFEKFLRQSDSNILQLQKNHFLERRSIPDDPDFIQQWWIINDGRVGVLDADIDLEEAWALSTGGLTPLGDTIVVAVLDNGIKYDHPDLQGNLWTNNGEIENNGIDDDGNGYVDDYLGWNVNLENDNIEPETFGGGVQDSHGTEITGIIGARSDNGVGVAGVNWNIKVMTVNINIDLSEADMIAAYAYVLDQRIIYNESDGQKGAYVVATNLSYGDEDLDPDENPIWCNIYDTLGTHGILNCAATANTAINIDTIRDVPTSCTSDFLISVTASTIDDERTFGAFGANDIDLAAPGREIYSTSIPNYGFATGTSFATPMVVGTIALLYSSPCSDLANLAQTDPAAAALMARSLIEDNVDTLSALQGEVRTGGRLNTGKAALALVSGCQSCVVPTNLAEETTTDSVMLSFFQADSILAVDLRWRLRADTAWNLISEISSPFSLDGLTSCSTYDYQLISNCSDGTGDSTSIRQFTTDGCCKFPMIKREVTDDSILLTVVETPETNSFEVKFRHSDSTDFALVIFDTTNTAVIGDLSPCSTYEIELTALCDPLLVNTDFVSTLGCNTCIDSVYCVPTTTADSTQFIDSISVHTLAHQSGANGGYGDFTGGPGTRFKPGSNYELAVFPGSLDSVILETRYYLWIDLDQSGSFENETELLSLSDSTLSSPYSAPIRIPESAMLGSTRMRVASVLETSSDTLLACDEITFGEAEDYCVEIIFDSLICPETAMVDTVMVGETNVEFVWDRVDSSIAYTYRWREVGEEEWMDGSDTTNTFSVDTLEGCKMYEFQVNTVCAFDTSGYTESFVFGTTCETVSTFEASEVAEVLISPNPFTSYIQVYIESTQSDKLSLSLHALDGRRVIYLPDQRSFNGANITIADLELLPPGMYLLAIDNGHSRMVRKLIKS